MITEQYIIGIDDTDTAETAGTGALIRALSAQIEADGTGQCHGVTRHQLWQNKKVPATNENYAYALVANSEKSILDIEDYIVDFVRDHAERDADPGVAIMTRHSDLPHVLAFGRRSQQELMRVDWAQTFSTESNTALRALGRNRQGAIGAMAAAGLRAGGKDGIYIDLRGLRDITGNMTAGQIRESTDLQSIFDEEGEPLDRDDPIETRDWIRPRLEDGQPVLHTTRSKEVWSLWLVDDPKIEDDIDD